MNIFQRALFKRNNVYEVPAERDEHWTKFLELTKCKKSMQDYILSIGGYYDRRTHYPLEWDVSTTPDLDYEDFEKWLKEHNEFEFEAEDAIKRGIAKEAYEEDKNSLWERGVEDAARTLHESDTYQMTRFSPEMLPWKGYQLGRGGKHLCPYEMGGHRLVNLDDFEDFVKGLGTTELFRMFMLCLELSICLTSKAIDAEVQHQAFWRLAQQVEYLYEQRGIGKYEIVKAFEYNSVHYFRVKNTETGEESMLGTEEECKKIIELAEAGELKGSFAVRS